MTLKPCYECKTEVDEEDYFCWGCEEIICDNLECGGKIPYTLAEQMGKEHDGGMHYIPADGYDEFGEEIDE